MTTVTAATKPKIAYDWLNENEGKLMVHAAGAACALVHSYLPFHRGFLRFRGGRPNRKVGGFDP